jgi:DNA-directed RNA polymerase subunit H (RpoH/RPB5)
MSSRDYIVQSLKTLLEMLNDRGITTGVSPEDAGNLIGANLNHFEFIIDKIKIIYYLTSKFKWPNLEKSFSDDEPYELYILVVKDKPSQTNLKSINTKKLQTQVFGINELQFNITKHFLVPKHELVKESEVEDIIKQYSLKSKNQFPIILKTDAMAKYLNLKHGDLVKITRVSPTAGEYIEYRCCL